jgi:RNA polymerase sporulation-specific sigma factor
MDCILLYLTMSSPENSYQPTFANVSELLFSVAEQAEKFGTEAEQRLHQNRDTDARYRALKAKAHLIQGLPSILEDFKSHGGEVPKEVEDSVLGLSFLASCSLDTDNLFGMSILLVGMGPEEGQPDELAKLAIKYQPDLQAIDKPTKLTRQQRLNQLAPRAKSGDTQAIQSLYENAMQWTYSIIKSNEYGIPWGTYDDLCQEGLIGVIDALESWDESRGNFVSFAGIAIRRNIMDALKQANRLKHSVLNTAVSLSSSPDKSNIQSNESEVTLAETIKTTRHNPVEDTVISRENVRAIFEACSTELSPLESAVFVKYIDGCSWVEIAEALEDNKDLQSITKITPATVDNALQRIKRKLARFR